MQSLNLNLPDYLSIGMTPFFKTTLVLVQVLLSVLKFRWSYSGFKNCFAPFLMSFFFFAYLSHLNQLIHDHQTNLNSRQR